MAVSYKKLWHMLLDRNMKKRDLERKAGVSEYVIKKMTHNDSVGVEVLGKICKALNCTVEDFVEFIDEEEKDKTL